MMKDFTMTKIIMTVVSMGVVLGCISCQPSSAKRDKPVSHPFLCADYGGNMIRIISVEGQSVWEYPANKPLDAWQMPDGNILFSHIRGIMEVTRDKEIVWEYKTKKPNEIHTCQPLGNGVYLVGVSGPCEIIEIDRNGKRLKTVKLTTNQKRIHGQMRQIRKTKQGTYLVGHNADRVVREYDTNGKVIRTFDVGGNPYSAIRLENGNTLIGTGDGHKLVEVDKDDNIVWQINENELDGNPLRFVAGVQRLANGNTIVCNWGGHGHIGGQPQIFEVTRDKKVVWELFDYENFKTITNVQLLDVKGDVTKGELIK
jgi:hypothetical protein